MISSIRSARTLGLAGLLVAMVMVVVASVGVASASAAECPLGESPCFITKKTPEPFTSHGAEKEKAVLETKAGRKIECENTTAGQYTVKDTGEITGPRHSKETVTFKGKCHSTAFGAGECHSIEPNFEEGRIITKPLVNKPVYLGAGEKASEGVGIALAPESGGLFAEFECKTIVGPETVKVGLPGGAGGDSIVCPVTPINTLATEYLLTCRKKGTEVGIQEFVKYFEGGISHTDFLETEGKGPETFTEQSAQITTAKIIPTEAGEVKA